MSGAGRTRFSSVAGERLQYLDGDTFGLDDTLFVFQGENGHVSRVRLDNVEGSFALSRTPASVQSQ